MTSAEAFLQLLKEILPGTHWEGKVFVAGGYVRDYILGQECKDIDLVINEPSGGIQFATWLAKWCGVYSEGSNPCVFPKFGTAKLELRGRHWQSISFDGLQIECVMPRAEFYVFGSRNPVVRQATLLEDVQRRDFTINSLLIDATTGAILDLTGNGFRDLHRGILQTSIDPANIFRDDPLRLLRAVRFAGRMNYKLANSLVSELMTCGYLISSVSTERVQEELNKMLLSKNPSWAIEQLSNFGLLQHILPEIECLRGVEQNKYHDTDVFYHTLKVLDQTPPNLLDRLIALFHDCGKPITKSVTMNGTISFLRHEDVGADLAAIALSRLRYSNEMIHNVKTGIKEHMRLKASGPEGNDISNKALRRFVLAVPTPLRDSVLTVMHADNQAHSSEYCLPKQIPGIRSRIENLLLVAPAKPNLPVNGHDIMKYYDIGPGKHLKSMLNDILDAWLDNPTLTRAAAFTIAADRLSEVKNSTK